MAVHVIGLPATALGRKENFHVMLSETIREGSRVFVHTHLAFVLAALHTLPIISFKCINYVHKENDHKKNDRKTCFRSTHTHSLVKNEQKQVTRVAVGSRCYKVGKYGE